MFLICRQSYDLASRIQNKFQIYFYCRAWVTYSKLRLSERKTKYYLSFFEREEFPWAMRKTYLKLRKSITEILHQQSQSLIVDHQIQWNWWPNSVNLMSNFTEFGFRKLNFHSANQLDLFFNDQTLGWFGWCFRLHNLFLHLACTFCGVAPCLYDLVAIDGAGGEEIDGGLNP